MQIDRLAVSSKTAHVLCGSALIILRSHCPPVSARRYAYSFCAHYVEALAHAHQQGRGTTVQGIVRTDCLFLSIG